MRNNIKKNKIVRVAVSCGDAAGISYEVVFKALKRLLKEEIRACFLLIGDWGVAEFTLKYLKLKLEPRVISGTAQIKVKEKNVDFMDLNLIRNFSLRNVGQPDMLLGKASLKYVEKACEVIKRKKADCLVTSPINKKSVCLSVNGFKGHTEFLADYTGAKHIAMMIGGKKLRVTLVTRHIPLAEVSKSLKKQDIFYAIELTDSYLKRYCGIREPEIALCALNPHAGEGGFIGREEHSLVLPAARRALDKKINLIGPLASDAVFEKAYRGEFDAVICLYHDQGLIPLKMIEREKSVNITLGLPFIRTSPAHGTAYDIAYQNKADSSSFYYAVKKAVEMSGDGAK